MNILSYCSVTSVFIHPNIWCYDLEPWFPIRINEVSMHPSTSLLTDRPCPFIFHWCALQKGVSVSRVFTWQCVQADRLLWALRRLEEQQPGANTKGWAATRCHHVHPLIYQPGQQYGWSLCCLSSNNFILDWRWGVSDRFDARTRII